MVCDNAFESCKYSSDYYDSYSSSYDSYNYDGYGYGNRDPFSSTTRYNDGIISAFNRGYLCNGTSLGVASGMGGFTFLCAILFALQGWRIWSNKKRGIPIFQFTTSRGLSEISVLLTTLFVVLQLILGWAQFGIIKSACSTQEAAIDMAEVNLRMATAKIESAHESIRTLVHMLPAIVAFTFLASWFARLSNSLQFTVFSLGFSLTGRIILYFQYFVCFVGIVVTGIAIPAFFSGLIIELMEYNSDQFGTHDNDWNVVAILLILHIVADILFIITSMILTSLTSHHIKRLNQNPKARSLWTLNIISILPPVACLITIRITFGLIICLCLYFIFTYYFALVLAYLPGYRFWRKSWRDADFDDDLASTTNDDEERGAAQPEMAERATPAPAVTQESRAPTPPPVVPEIEGDRISVESDAKADDGQVAGGESSKTAARYA